MGLSRTIQTSEELLSVRTESCRYMKLGVFLILNGDKIAMNEIDYSRYKMEYASKGIPFTEDKGLFHKWLYVNTDDQKL